MLMVMETFSPSRYTEQKQKERTGTEAVSVETKKTNNEVLMGRIHLNLEEA